MTSLQYEVMDKPISQQHVTNRGHSRTLSRGNHASDDATDTVSRDFQKCLRNPTRQQSSVELSM